MPYGVPAGTLMPARVQELPIQTLVQSFLYFVLVNFNVVETKLLSFKQLKLDLGSVTWPFIYQLSVYIDR